MMKYLIKWVGLVMILAVGALSFDWYITPVDAQAMTNAEARTEARVRWGIRGTVLEVSTNTTAWNRAVGINSTGCAKITPDNPAGQQFTVFGYGSNWENAFAAVQATAIKGPYSGPITLTAKAWDNVGVAGFQWLLNGLPLGGELTPTTPGQEMVVMKALDSKDLANDKYVLCAKVRDTSGNLGYSSAMLIWLDQTKPTIGTILQLAQAADGTPVVGK